MTGTPDLDRPTRCRKGIDHEPQYLSADGHCIHIEMATGQPDITWNWATGEWEDDD